MKSGEWFEGTYVFDTEQDRTLFREGFDPGAANAPGSQIIGSSPAEGEAGRSVLEAAVPQLELLDYAISLRSLAHGTGTFHREHRGYEQLPERLAKDHVGERGRHT